MVRTYRSPKSLVERIAKLYNLRKQLERQAEELQREEAQLLEQALGLFTEKGVPQLALDSGHKVTIGTRPIATITDWAMLVYDVASRAHETGPGPLRDSYLSVIHKRVSPTQLEALSFEKKFIEGVVLEHKKVATFSAPRGKSDAE